MKEVEELQVQLAEMMSARQVDQTALLQVNEENNAKKATIEEYSNSIQQLRTALQQAELQIKLSESATKTIEASHAQVVQQNSQLHAQVLALQTQLAEKDHATWPSQLATAQISLQEQQHKYSSLEATYNQRGIRLEQCLDENSKLREINEQLQLTIQDLSHHIETQLEAEAVLSESKARFEQLSITQAEELAKLKEKVNQLTEELELAHLERDEFAAELHRAQSQLDVASSVHSVKVDQIQNVMRANLEMAGSLKDLMNKFGIDIPGVILPFSSNSNAQPASIPPAPPVSLTDIAQQQASRDDLRDPRDQERLAEQTRRLRERAQERRREKERQRDLLRSSRSVTLPALAPNPEALGNSTDQSLLASEISMDESRPPPLDLSGVQGEGAEQGGGNEPMNLAMAHANNNSAAKASEPKRSVGGRLSTTKPRPKDRPALAASPLALQSVADFPKTLRKPSNPTSPSGNAGGSTSPTSSRKLGSARRSGSRGAEDPLVVDPGSAPSSHRSRTGRSDFEI
eukprot:TRINITY_DN12794_c0_g1_i1.p1 TRINITY_DN12794_c0_g1~~TRINITY_DN12794_c0_g1_i1.p1  ORF type:complete len:568 (+),score=122.81 TRINITY_DN12794_c0_g1_i1:156-1706(+)